MNTSKPYAPNDLVTVIVRKGPCIQLTVTAVKQYKRGPKVTTSDGRTWDIKGRCMWGSRGDAYSTSFILHATDDHALQLRHKRELKALDWLADNSIELTPDELTAVAKIAVEARRRAVEARRRAGAKDT